MDDPTAPVHPTSTRSASGAESTAAAAARVEPVFPPGRASTQPDPPPAQGSSAVGTGGGLSTAAHDDVPRDFMRMMMEAGCSGVEVRERREGGDCAVLGTWGEVPGVDEVVFSTAAPGDGSAVQRTTAGYGAGALSPAAVAGGDGAVLSTAAAAVGGSGPAGPAAHPPSSEGSRAISRAEAKRLRLLMGREAYEEYIQVARLTGMYPPVVVYKRLEPIQSGANRACLGVSRDGRNRMASSKFSHSLSFFRNVKVFYAVPWTYGCELCMHSS